VVTENLNEGTDAVQSYISNYTLAANVENLTLMSQGNSSGTGNGLANTITGNSGNNVLNGGFGNDTLIGGAGDDVLDGAIDQTIRFYSMTPTTGNGTAKVYLGAASDGATLTISGGVLPNVQAGQSIRYSGGAADESVYVTAGSTVDATRLITSGGNDRVYLTGKFVDYSQSVNEFGTYTFTRINGLASGQSEVVKVSSASDSDVLYFADGHVLMQSDLVQVNAGTSLQDQDSGAYRLIQALDLLAGGTGWPADTPLLSMGADTLIGGTGNDTYTVDDVGDVVTENLNEGTDTVQSYLNSYTLAANVENLQLMGVQNINGTGNGLDNTITGNSGSNVLTGGAGADTFVFKTSISSNNADTISDFSRADGDVIALSSAIFAKLMGKTNLTNNYRLSNQAAVGGDDYIVYNASTGQLAYDVSGNGSSNAVVFATLQNKPQDITAQQFVVI
jgi:Ca2+-binding RTX toxin-like protein